MVRATLYIEGGGDGKALRIRFRMGWNKFFGNAGVGAKTKVVRVVGVNRPSIASPQLHRATLPILLVDSESPVNPEHSNWEHLHNCNGWEQPEGTGEDQAFLMVQVMETWFLADHEALRRYFGSRFREGVLRAWPDLETVSKQRVLETL